MTFRAARRLAWFIWEVGVIVVNYGFTAALASSKNRRLARAAWLSRSSRRHLKIFGYSAAISGPVPRSGLLISNHLSYLDILAICAAAPAVFVSKADVRRWPVFGWLAALGGTVFIERERRTHVGAVNREIETALADGALVVVFPEGTSSDGTGVLPFRASLLEPALRGGHPISAAWIHYELADGDARQEVCYWGDHTFLPHLLNLMGKKSVRATLRFATFNRTTDDRKELATQLREAVLKLKDAATGNPACKAAGSG
ncbi:MAG: lysophospholipid acyltransferase family protein [Verrucomicrobiota bacterium]